MFFDAGMLVLGLVVVLLLVVVLGIIWLVFYR